MTNIYINEHLFENIRRCKDDVLFHELYCFAERYIGSYLFKPEELPINFYGTMLFGMTYAAYKGCYSCYTPFNGSTKKLSNLILFLGIEGEEKLRSIFEEVEKRISTYSESDIDKFDQGKLDNELILNELTNVVWNNEIEKMVTDPALVKRIIDRFWSSEALTICSIEEIVELEKRQIDKIDDYWVRLEECKTIKREICELLSMVEERYHSYGIVFLYDAFPFELLRIETTVGSRLFAEYRDSIELLDLDSHMQLAYKEKPEFANSWLARKRMSYQDAIGWRCDVHARKILLPDGSEYKS